MKGKPVREVTPLLQRCALQPGESLPSLLVRLTKLNGYASMGLLEKLVQPASPDRLDCPSHPETFHRLELLTGIAALDLWAASDHGYAALPPDPTWAKWQPVTDLREIPVPGLAPPLLSAIHPTQASWFCPLCLAEAAYHRLCWRPVSTAVCFVHHCLLLSGCPACHRPVSVRDIVQLRCPFCYADLRKAQPVSLDREDWGMLTQWMLWGWRTNQAVPDRNWPRQPGVALSSLAEGLALAMVYLPRPVGSHARVPEPSQKPRILRHAMQHFPPSELLGLYAAALQRMVDWPEHFRELLYGCQPDPNQEVEIQPISLYRYWTGRLWNHPRFQFIWEAYHTFREDRLWFATGFPDAKMAFRQLPAYACLREAAGILSVPENGLPYLAQIQGIAQTNVWSWHHQPIQPFFRRIDLQQVRQNWEEPLSLLEAAHWLGISTDTMTRLGKTHTLPSLQKDVPCFAKKAVIRFLSRLDACTQRIAYETKLIPLKEAAQQLHCVGLDEAHLLKLVVSQRLRAYRRVAQPAVWESSEISFTQADLDRLMSTMAEEKRWIPVGEAAARLQVHEWVLLDWIERGLLEPVATYNTRPYLKNQEISRFLAQFIFQDEVLKRLKIPFSQMMRFIQQNELQPVAGPGWDGCDFYVFLRKQVERLGKLLKL